MYTIQWVPEHGNHHYKYLVDDDWQVAPNQPTEECDGVVNNVINLDHFVTLEEEEKNQIREEKERTERLFNEHHEPPSFDSFAGDPPILPPYLRQIILNKPSKDGIANHLCTPSHVTINHLYCRSLENGMVITGSTVRYKKKFVTTIYFNYVPK